MTEPLGHEHFDEIAADYIDRLAANWPHPREQLHHGGWQATYDMVARLKLDKAHHALDLCCGEGGTARWLAKTYQRRVSGVDILEGAVATAKQAAVQEKVDHLVDFTASNIFQLPFADKTFDVIYGQDPDGLAHYKRAEIFRECIRVLQPGGRIGFQHWIPYQMPEAEKARFEQVTVDVGFPSMHRLSAEEYADDLRAAGFVDVHIEDLSVMYLEHLKGVERLANERSSEGVDEWTRMVIDLLEQGYKIGVWMSARKPDTKSARDMKSLFFYGQIVIDTNVIFDFETNADEAAYTQALLTHLKQHAPEFGWYQEGVSYKITGKVDNYAPPKLQSFLCARLDNVVADKSVPIRLEDGRIVTCQMHDIFANFYPFNAGVIHFKLDVPKDYWHDLEVLRQIRYFVQVAQAAEGASFDTDLERIAGPAIKALRMAFDTALKSLPPPRMDDSLLDFTELHVGFSGEIRWTHATLVTVMPEPFDPNTAHYQTVMRNVHPDGVHNTALNIDHYAFIESGDSLVCVPDRVDLGREPDVVAYESWVRWIALHQYTWKMAWELDRGLHIILNNEVRELKRKQAVHDTDVYALNALLNRIRLTLDTHKPSAITSDFRAIRFLEEVASAWRTTELLEGASDKMDALRDIIGQLDEIKEARRDARLEMFLTVLGVLSLGSLIVDLYGAVSFTEGLPDVVPLGLALGIPSLMMVIAVILMRK